MPKLLLLDHLRSVEVEGVVSAQHGRLVLEVRIVEEFARLKLGPQVVSDRKVIIIELEHEGLVDRFGQCQ